MVTDKLVENYIKIEIKKQNGVDAIYRKYPVVGEIKLTSLNLIYNINVIKLEDSFALRTFDINTKGIPFPDEFDTVNNTVEQISKRINSREIDIDVEPTEIFLEPKL